MRNLTILFIFLFFQIKQNYSFSNYILDYNITNEAEWLYDQGKYDKAEELYLIAFK